MVEQMYESSGASGLDLSPEASRLWRGFLPDDILKFLPDDIEEVPEAVQDIFRGEARRSGRGISDALAQAGYSFKRTQGFRVVCWLASQKISLPKDGDPALVGVVNDFTGTVIATRLKNGLLARHLDVALAMQAGIDIRGNANAPGISASDLAPKTPAPSKGYAP